METADVVVIGGGVVGCATAHHLLRLQPGLDVLLLEREHVGAGSTSRSTAAFRHQWSVPAHVAFSRYSSAEYDDLAARGHPVAFRRNGYLFLFTDPARLAEAAARAARQREHGVRVEVLRPDELPDRVPCGRSLRLEALAGATWGPDDGFLDPLAAAQAYLSEARGGGLRYRPGAEVTGMERDAGGLSAVRLAGGERIGTRAVVSAAGVWSRSVVARAGLDLPLRPAKRYLYHSHPLGRTATSGWPMVIGDRGAHTRPAEGGTLLLAWEHRPSARDPLEAAALWAEQDRIDPGFGTGIEEYGVEVMAELARLVPAFEEEVGLAHVTCGWYAVTPDHKAILGEDPRLPGLFHACGFSGHGIMHAPASARTVAELVLDAETTVVPRPEVERHFGIGPLLEGRPREPVESMVL
jgi:sarcosine oxidase, subunit beta